MRTRRSSRRIRRRYNKGFKKFLIGCFAIICFAVSINLIALILPFIDVATRKIAMFSAGISAESSSTSSNPQVSSKPQSIKPAAVNSKISKPANAGIISRMQFKPGAAPLYVPLKNGAAIKNVTQLSFDKVKSESSLLPEFKITADGKPEVLIMHTHATEAYEPITRDYFDPAYNSRSTDKTKNTIYVGDKIESELQKSGIGVLHDFTLHDNPSYTNAYNLSAKTVEGYLKKYPTIKVVLDVHRDAIRPSDTERTAPSVNINGKSAAQVMIISGCDDGNMNFPNYLKNLRLSSMLASQTEADYSGIMRPILFDYRDYNQRLTTGSILLEMGSDSNSLDEAACSGTLIGKSLAKVLLSLKGK